MYQPCSDCGSLVSCYCFTPGRFIEDTFSETLHAVQSGLGAADTLDLNSSIYNALTTEVIEAGGIEVIE